MANKNIFIGYDDDLQFNKPYRCPYCFSHGIIKYNVNLPNYEYTPLYPVGEKNTEYRYYDVRELMKLPDSVRLTPGKHLDVAWHHNHYQLPSKEEQEYLFHNFQLDPNDKTPIKTKKGTVYLGEGTDGEIKL